MRWAAVLRRSATAIRSWCAFSPNFVVRPVIERVKIAIGDDLSRLRRFQASRYFGRSAGAAHVGGRSLVLPPILWFGGFGAGRGCAKLLIGRLGGGFGGERVIILEDPDFGTLSTSHWLR